MKGKKTTHIEDAEKYFGKLIRNSNKNEFRSKDNERKHAAPGGLNPDGRAKAYDGTEAIEQELALQSPEDWLRFIEHPQLLAGLRSLRPDDLRFIFTICKYGFTQRQMAEHLGVNQNVVHKRWKRILVRLRRFF